MAYARDPDEQISFLHSAYDVASVRDMEASLLDEGVPLMRMASSAVAQVSLDMLAQRGVEVDEAHVVLLVGGGNNGGDGLYACAKLAQLGAEVIAVSVGRAVHQASFSTFVNHGGKVLVLDPQAHIPGCDTGFDADEAAERLRTAKECASRAELIIDAMTGIGLHGALSGIPAIMAASVKLMVSNSGSIGIEYNDEDVEGQESGRPLILAVDTPSGLGIDDGTLPGSYIPANVTVMLGVLKPCAMLPPAAYACGRVTLVDLGFDIDSIEPAIEAIDEDLASQSICLPSVTDSKYSRGVVGLVTGSQRYPGAAVLSSIAAARSGAGMIRYSGPQQIQSLVLSQLPEAVMGKGKVQSWVVGSGVPIDMDDTNTSGVQQDTIFSLLAPYQLESADNQGTQDDGLPVDNSDLEAPGMVPVCVDAGALELLPARVSSQVVITPHAGELAGLLGRLGEEVEVNDVLAQPWYWANRVQDITGATVLLKGAITMIVGPDGQSGRRTLISGSAPAWLATAGAGDVLSGILGALMAQNAEDLDEDGSLMVDTAAAAAYLHGRAAAIASNCDHVGWKAPRLYSGPYDSSDDHVGHPIIASDIIDAIPQALEQLLS